jgi:hypothetical protein
MHDRLGCPGRAGGAHDDSRWNLTPARRILVRRVIDRAPVVDGALAGAIDDQVGTQQPELRDLVGPGPGNRDDRGSDAQRAEHPRQRRARFAADERHHRRAAVLPVERNRSEDCPQPIGCRQRARVQPSVRQRRGAVGERLGVAVRPRRGVEREPEQRVSR